MTTETQNALPDYSPLRDEPGLQPIAYWLIKAFEEIDAAYFRNAAFPDREPK